MEPKPAEEWEEALAELHIGVDGKIRVFGLNAELMEVLAVVSGAEGAIARKRKLAKACLENADERADEIEPPVPARVEGRRSG
jgi:hypothetical protein